MRKLTIVASLIVLAASFAPSVLAQGKGKGKGQNATTTSIGLTLNVADDVNGDGILNWGDSVTFEVSTSETWHQVNVTCTQNGAVVFGAIWPNTQLITLSSTSWHSGAAECTAAVINFSTKKVLASLNFAVAE